MRTQPNQMIAMAAALVAAAVWTPIGASQVPIRMTPVAPAAPVSSTPPAAPVTTPVAPVTPPIKVVPVGPIATPPPSPGPIFYLRSYLGRCLDTASGQVLLADCNGSASQQIEIDEVNPQHDVILRAGTRVLGINVAMTNVVAASTNASASGSYTLELQAPANLNMVTSRNQIFSLDGDSIILASSRPCVNSETQLCPPPPPQMVVQSQNAVSANGTPVVVAPRNLNDNEFWDINAVDGSGKFPTLGFVPVATNYDLWNALCTPQVKMTSASALPVIVDPGQPDDATYLYANVGCNPKAPWGTTVVVAGSDPNCTYGACIDLGFFPPLTLGPGVTLRGTRRGVNPGANLYQGLTGDGNNRNPPGHCEGCMIEVLGDYVRVTGLTLTGATAGTNWGDYTTGIEVTYPGAFTGPLFSAATTTQFIAIIDHNAASNWGSAAVAINGPYPFESDICGMVYQGRLQFQQTCTNYLYDPSTNRFVTITDDPSTLANVRVERNFLHHNERDSGGYGVVTGSGGRVSIRGNTFLMNRHAIASDGEPHNEYRAANNLVLSDAPQYGSWPFTYYNQDFDMHGTNGGYGDVGGFYEDIVGNTFLGTNRANYWLRGQPSFNTDFHANVTQRKLGDSVVYHPCPPTFDGVVVCQSGPTPINVYSDNHFRAQDPTGRLGVGDFDGDGRDDLFLATGAALYYAAGGSAAWRLLSAKTETLDQLLLGDFDGNGRTDVVAIHNGQFVVSWGGISDWQVLNPDPTGGRLLLLPNAVSAMTVADFDGDGIADIFWADGASWWVSYGGNTPFVLVQTSSFRVPDLRFGDFNGDGAADVFGVTGNTWSVSYSPKLMRNQIFSSWTPLPVSLTNTSNGLVVADFNGDRVADIASNSGDGWQISYGGAQAWRDVPQSTGLVGSQFAGVGRFLGQAHSDVLVWDANRLSISAEGTNQLTIYSPFNVELR